MTGRQTIIRSMHDIGLAAWFGGSLFGAVGLNGAAAAVRDPEDRTRVAAAGWGKWTPVSIAAGAVHAVGGLGLIAANSGRVAAQSGTRGNTVVKSVLTVAAAGVTVYSGIQGAKLGKQAPVPAKGATEPSAETPEETAKAQRQLKLLQWAIPVLTGTLIALGAQQGEQQKASQVVKGLLPGRRS